MKMELDIFRHQDSHNLTRWKKGSETTKHEEEEEQKRHESIEGAEVLETDVRDGVVACEGKEGSELVDVVQRAAIRATSLNFCDSFLGNDGCERFVERFKSSVVLVRLDLKGNGISEVGAQAIADLLRENKSLRFLSLEWNSIGSIGTGIQALASGLEQNNSLLELDLRNNCIGPEGGLALARAIRINSTLKTLDLRWNELGASGGRALIQSIGLQGNRALVELLLSGNNVSSLDLSLLEKALDRNRHPERMSSRGPSMNLTPMQTGSSAEDKHVAQKAMTPELDCTSDEERQDSRAFAERVVSLEAELREHEARASSTLERLQEESSLRHKSEDREAVLTQSLAKAHLVADELRSQLVTLQGNLAAAHQSLQAQRQETERAIHDAAARESAIGILKTELMETHQQVKGLRESCQALEARLGTEREERLQAAKLAADDRLHVAKCKEDLLRQQLAHQRECDHAAKQALQVQRAHEERIAAFLREQSESQQSFREQLESVEQQHKQQLAAVAAKHAEDIRQAEEKHKQLVQETAAAHEADMELIRKQAQQQIVQLREKHKEETAAERKRHALQQSQAEEAAAQRAVEEALKDAVREAVAQVAKQMEGEHKRKLWQREKEIGLEARAEAQKRVDQCEAEKRLLEEQINSLRQKVLENDARNSAQMNALQERMRQAVSDAFKPSG